VDLITAISRVKEAASGSDR